MARRSLLVLAAVLAALGAASGAPDAFTGLDDSDFAEVQQPWEGSASHLMAALESAAETAGLPVTDMALKWADFKAAYGKSYETLEEEATRIRVFADNLQVIKEHNARYDNGETTFTMGINDFSDLTREEFSAIYLSNRIELPSDIPMMDESEFANLTEPASVDWRRAGIVSRVKHQGHCGSCWAFATTGVLESAYAIKTRRLLSLSEQQLVDCAKGRYGNAGCNGGRTSYTILYVRDHGITLERNYPYETRDGRCRYSPRMKAIGATGYQGIPTSAVARALAAYGPLAVSMDAKDELQHYDGRNVYYNPQCNTHHHNHALLLVGYTRDYWLVKNSWGANWGDRGYLKIARRRGNDCGISFAVIRAFV